ncbi:5-methylcytosine-specific restriction endonuclease system specificity protein McrC [Brevundimonas lenta]|uniref:5-methylcytosine-specific restriction enzyme subunit McrC n=1 Tax=Brevundimonas lenta TaxID=424796 RepID=A0A7W6JDH6_9CAUL|nr:5-methylcytosine-specific restriction endonuclease system specificity protein McrC [Brevundimonas lenta]MBB4083051.1 5-methylcytosine-specific restriction enzyme subunit McrC [Brevundimonas lenta]
MSVGEGRIGRIPVRNIWLLFLYASDLARFGDRFDAALIEDGADLPSLVARILVHAVERRLRRSLSTAYRPCQAALTRVRGRIDILRTDANRLLDRGQVACRFEEFTVDTPRNRLVRAALDAIAARVRDRDLSRRCRTLAADLDRTGVSARRPTPAELAVDVISRNEAEDRLMVAAARLALDLALPTEDSGSTALNAAERDERAARKLFEKAVAGFYAAELRAKDGWKVNRGTHLDWQIEDATSGMRDILPAMRCDVVLDNATAGRRLVIDTKFTHILTSGWHRARSVRSNYLYQIYAYLRSQAGRHPLADRAEGLLLHPAVDAAVDEEVVIQGHRIRFATVDLAAKDPGEIRKRLLDLALRPDLAPA